MMQPLANRHKNQIINVLDAIHYISSAWDSMQPEIIRNCFKKAKFGAEVEGTTAGFDVMDDPDLTRYEDYLHIDDNLLISEV